MKMLDADRPITTSQQDRLSRTVFAKYLARCILDHESHDSLVIGLYGGWGVGKTSVINLMLEELNVASSNMFDDERPIILNFSPWSYSGQDTLIYNFFRRLSSEISQAPYFENAREILFLLELYISFFTHKPVPKVFLPKQSGFERMFRYPRMDEQFAWESGRDLTHVKAELNELLRNQKHKLVIIIDNITRLEDMEVKQIFQIVKSIGDFANTVYVLAFDKEHIIQVLNNVQEESGADFLDKIVQLPFTVPPISPPDLETIFIDRLKHIVTRVPAEAWDSHYWADLYYSSLKDIFHNVRDISRYLNTVSFGYEYVKDVVNPVDFFAITALEVFTPAVYEGIRENKDLFTDLMDNVYELNETKIAEDKRRCDEILQRTEKISKEQLLQFLIRLFPRLRHLYGKNVDAYHSEALAHKNKRICDPDIFDIYFGLSMSTGTIPDREMNAILAMVNDEQGFALALLRLNKDEKIIKFLDLLDSNWTKHIPKEYDRNVVAALLDGGDLFPEGESSMVSFTTPMRIHRIFHQLLKRYSDEERFGIYKEAMLKTVNSLYSIVHELTALQQEHAKTEEMYLPVESRDVTLEQLNELKKLAVPKIASWAESGRLIEHPKLLPILYAWDAWGESEACKRYVAQVTQDDRGLLAFLEAALKAPIDQAGTNWRKNPEWRKSLKHIEDFISPQLLEPHAKQLFEDLEFEKLREREQLALLIFLDLIHAKTVKIIPKTS